MPAPIAGPMPLGDAQDPPVDRIALAAARHIDALIDEPTSERPTQRITKMQIVIERAINEALDRCQALGGRRTR
ncbi:hypothetical protein [Methylobacterium terrae]|nr:hypothetical protein [Methylobacterium terrae]